MHKQHKSAVVFAKTMLGLQVASKTSAYCVKTATNEPAKQFGSWQLELRESKLRESRLFVWWPQNNDN